MNMIEFGVTTKTDPQLAEYADAITSYRISRFEQARAPLAIAAAVLGSSCFVIVYGALLSRIGLARSDLALSAVLLASTLSSIAGFAFSAICGVMLLQIMTDPVRTVEVMMVCSIAIQSFSVAVLWRDIEWKTLLRFLVGGVVGLPLGVWLLLHLGRGGFKEALGGLLTAYAAYVLLKRPVTISANSMAIDASVGFLGGITGGLAGFPGAAVTVWCGMQGWDKRRQRGIYQPFILIMQVLALAVIAVMRTGGGHGQGVSVAPLQFVPMALLGTWFGLTIFKHMSDRVFTLVVNLLLLVSGIGLML
jgi:uncharacterized protein